MVCAPSNGSDLVIGTSSAVMAEDTSRICHKSSICVDACRNGAPTHDSFLGQLVHQRGIRMAQGVDLNELIQSQFEGISMQGFLESAVATGGRAAGRSVTGGEVLGALAVCEVWRAPQISTCGIP